MTLEQYLSDLENDIKILLSESRLNFYKNQMYAWKLKSSFTRSFQEDFLFNRALYISTNASILLESNSINKIALQGLKESAEIFEYLSELQDISNYYDKENLILLSALCYDIAGYQANALCITNRIERYLLESKIDHNLESDNKIINQIMLILKKKIPYANELNEANNEDNAVGYEIFHTALKKWYSSILELKEEDFYKYFTDAYRHYLSQGNIYISHLLFLLRTRTIVFSERSIWNNLKVNANFENNKQWRKYVKLLSADYYSGSSRKEIIERVSIFELWTSQLRALQKGLLESNENFVVQMPTSAGKTFIAELLILKYLIENPGKKCVYIAPFRALTSEKEIELAKYLSKLGYSISSLSGSYELDEFQDVILAETDLLIATPEKIDLLFRLNANFFNQVSLVIVDEGHIIGDISARATLLEFLIIRLKITIPDLSFLFISAVMPPQNADEYSLWLSNKKQNVLRSLLFQDSKETDEWTPTRKLIGSFVWDKKNGKIIFKDIEIEDAVTHKKKSAFIPHFLIEKEFDNLFPNLDNKLESTGAIAYKLSFEGNTLVFCGQPKETEWVFKRLNQIIETIPLENLPSWFEINESKESYYYAKKWFGEKYYITQAIKIGIGIHFGDMPEQVRNSVESDFRNGKLRLLISTNTIGQGLNFPIKNIIIYSLIINYKKDKPDDKKSKPVLIQYRDFWNIVGRAGRAGKETEGKIIFVINSNNDTWLYKNFSDKSKIEDANSLIFQCLDKLSENILNPETFENDIAILSESYLLDLMSEELVGTEYQETIEKLINNSLFKIQAERKNLTIEPLTNSFRKIFKRIESQATMDQIKVYKLTGLSFQSNKMIDDYIDMHKNSISDLIQQDNYIEFIDFFLSLLSNNQINELSDKKLDKLVTEPNEFSFLIKQWISGTPIESMVESWIKNYKNIGDFHIYISKALYYLYPWGITAVILIATHKLSISIKDLGENLRNITSYVKYGLNNPTSCIARSLGIKERSVAMYLYEKSNKLSTKSFIKWLSDLTYEEIKSYQLNEYDKININNVSIKLMPFGFRETRNNYEFSIKGVFYNEEWQTNSRKISIGQSLQYIRDYKNEYDPYAIKIISGSLELGYVPRDLSKIISPEIDMDEKKIEITVKNISIGDIFNEIYVILLIIE